MKLIDKIKDMVRDGYDAIEISDLLKQPLFTVQSIIKKVLRDEDRQGANVSSRKANDDSGRSG